MSGQVTLQNPEPNSKLLSDRYLAAFVVRDYYHNDDFSNAPRFRYSDAVCAPINIYDGYHIIWRAEVMWNGGINLKSVLGVARPEEVVDKTYECAKRFAQEKAKSSSLPFVDETSRAKEGQLAKKVQAS